LTVLASGDRSHIPPASRLIYDTLSGELNRVKQSNLPVGRMEQTFADDQAHVKKIVDDTDRRLNILFDGLNNETVPESAIAQMNNITKGELDGDESGLIISDNGTGYERRTGYACRAFD